MTIEQALRALHDKAWRVGFGQYLRKGRVPPVIREIMTATQSVQAFKAHLMSTGKYSPDQPRVPAGNPDGGQWTSGGGGSGDNQGDPSTGDKPEQGRGPFRLPAAPPRMTLVSDGVGGGQNTTDYPMSRISSIADAQKLVASSGGRHVGEYNNCASLTHFLSPELPPTSAWLPGDKVQDNQDIPIGTPVATFNFQGQQGTNGYGPPRRQVGLSGYSHTGIYLGQDKTGLILLHQYWGSNGPRIETIPWASWGKTGQEGGSRYYTIDY